MRAPRLAMVRLALAALVFATLPLACFAGSASAKAPANGLPTLRLSIGDAYSYHGHRYVLPRTLVEVKGQVGAALDGQSITVRIRKRHHTVRSKTVTLAQRGGNSGFSFRFRTGERGKYLVDTELTPDVAALANAAGAKSVSVVDTNIHPGSKGVAVRLFQSKLAALHYVVPRGGHFDSGTGRALLAFRKVNGMARTESAGYKVARKLAEGRGGFHLRYKGAGRHVEVSIARQAMAFAANGKVVRIYHVSTGAPGTPTVRGTFHVYRKDWGTNAKGMVNSNYFERGYAIHGYSTVPPYNASHGCVRVPIPNAGSIFAWVHMGTRVDVY
ncbi:MAG: L,D-transpeptidase [Thermoleophilia bacterium]|nr:L,D-transpeptidase [Thermoleophilia bacterium]